MGAALLLNMICSIKIKKTTTKGVYRTHCSPFSFLITHVGLFLVSVIKFLFLIKIWDWWIVFISFLYSYGFSGGWCLILYIYIKSVTLYTRDWKWKTKIQTKKKLKLLSTLVLLQEKIQPNHWLAKPSFELIIYLHMENQLVTPFFFF